MEKNLLLFSVLVLLLLLLVFLISRKRTKHSKNIKKGSDIIKKLKGFEGDYIPQKQISYLRKIDPFVFEELLLDCFKKKGYKIKRNTRYTGDRGIDGTVFNQKGQKILIQAKRYKSYVNLADLKEFKEVIVREKAFAGYFIHTGKTGKTSKLEQSDNMKIISGQKLINLIVNS